MPFEIGLPTLTSDAFPNQKPNKQTSHEEQKTLNSRCISFCTSSRKRQLKTLQVGRKKSVSFSCQSKQLPRCCINFPQELTSQILTKNIKLDVERDKRVAMMRKDLPRMYFLKNWLNFRVRGQFEIKILIARGHSDINQEHKHNIFHKNHWKK